MDRKVHFALLLLGSLALTLTASGQECSQDTSRRCKRDALDALATEHSNAEHQCRSLREHLDCIVWQTSSCMDTDEQEANRDVITRVWRYLKSFCETQGSYWTKACFQREDVRRCESLLPATRGYSTDTASCRGFRGFRDCVTSIVRMECSVEERRLLGTYLMEKGQQRAWNCPRERTTYATSAPLALEDDTIPYELCSEEARGSLQDCRTEFQSGQKEAMTRNDSDMQHHKTCCALVKYESCVGRTLRDACGDTRGRSEARALVSDMKRRLPYYSCEDHTEVECSAAGHLPSPTATLLLLFLLVTVTVTMGNSLRW